MPTIDGCAERKIKISTPGPYAYKSLLLQTQDICCTFSISPTSHRQKKNTVDGVSLKEYAYLVIVLYVCM